MRKTTANILFRLICLLFSAALAVLTLLSGIDLTAESDRLNARQREIQALEEENRRLTAALESPMSLEELESYAIRTLGMQHCRPEQIIRIELWDSEEG